MKTFRRIVKKIICIFLVSALYVPVFSQYAYALENWESSCYTASEGACLMDADSKVVLFGKNENSAYYPASITKVLTALITLENCDNLSEQVEFSYDAVHIEEQNSTIIGASEGDKLSVLDCLYCLLFQSANEVANALAEHVGEKHPELKEEGMNDRQVFVKMMNEKAAELGCQGSHFNNPSGLTDKDHYVTAYDMCLIMAAAIKNERFLDIESHTYWTHAPIRRYPDVSDPWNTVYPKHLMLKKNSDQYYPGTIAGKTGYTMNAGNTLVTACVKDGMTLVTCVLNAHANHYNDTERLMDFGFKNFKSLRVSDYDNTNQLVENDFKIGTIPVIDSNTISIDENNRITIPKAGSYAEVEKSLRTVENSEDGVVAELVYTYGEKEVGTAALKMSKIGGSNYSLDENEDPLLLKLMGVEIETESADEAAITDESAIAEESKENSTKDGKTTAVTLTKNTDASQNEIKNTENNTDSKTDIENDKKAALINLEDTEEINEDDKSTGDSLETNKKSGGFLKTVLIILGVLAAGFAIITGINYINEKKENEERSRRRRERMKKYSDLTGTQKIQLDLMVEQSLRKKSKKRKR